MSLGVGEFGFRFASHFAMISPVEGTANRTSMTAYRSNGGTLVPLERVCLKPGWQGPQFLDNEKVKCLADLMRKGETEFPPIQVEETKDWFLVLDGHHRFLASRECSFTHIPVEVQVAPMGKVLK
jgi:ParB-like nuclease domain